MKIAQVLIVSLLLLSTAAWAGEDLAQTNKELQLQIRQLRMDLRRMSAELAELKGEEPPGEETTDEEAAKKPQPGMVEWPTQYSEEDYTRKELQNINRTLIDIHSELAEIRKEQAGLALEDKPDEQSNAISNYHVFKGPNKELLQTIKLPEDPSEDDINTYINKIIEATNGQNTLSPYDPQVEMLMQIGGDHLGLLIMKFQTLTISDCEYHLLEAIARLANDEHKKLILAKLPECPDLIEVITNKGWETDAKEILLAGLRNHPNTVNSNWIKAVANLKDPETYEVLKACLINNSPLRYHIFKMLADLPGIELEDAVAQAWEKAQMEGSRESIDAAKFTVQYGYLDALRSLVDAMVYEAKPMLFNTSQDFRNIILQHIDFYGRNDEIYRWFKDNHANLVFDKETRKFEVKESKAAQTAEY